MATKRDIIRQQIWSLIGELTMEVYAYQPNPAEYHWVMGEEMIELLSEGKGMVTIDPNSGKPMIHEWLVDVENDNQHPYWIYFLGGNKFVLKFEKMKEIILGDITLCNADCMDILRGMPDNSFDLAIVDPPYGIGASKAGCGSRSRKYDRSKKWDDRIPGDDYFRELRRVCKNSIVWGMNHFPALFPVRNFVVWDKVQPAGVSFAQAELAAVTFKGTSKIYRGTARGQKPRIHPTQKPVELYKWLLANYAKPGDKILDTHLGSGSICIACHDLGFEMMGIELDPEYYEAAKRRLMDHQERNLRCRDNYQSAEV